MKLTYRKKGIFLLLAVCGLLLLPFTTAAAVDEADYIVENLQINDIPNDDGSGLVISWKPLPKEKRIIEYRVYRGVNPDSLFYIGKIDVNVKTGVPGDEMYYYDIDFNYFADVRASARLRQEKQQPEGSPLFQRYPRDVNITGPRLKHYDILGVIPEKDFYYRNRKIEVATEEDTTVYAGLKLRNFSQLAKKLITDHEYYYTILAVNEARKYFPHAEPQIGIPRENAPELTRDFYAVFVEDLERLQFEWSLPTFTDDIYYHRIYAMRKADLENFNNHINELKEIEQAILAAKSDTTLAVPEAVYSNPGTLVFQRYSGYPYTPSQTVSIDLEESRIISPRPYPNVFTGQETEVEYQLDLDNLEDYYFVFSLYDQARYESFSTPSEIEIINSSELPQIVSFSVIDGEDDKGDYLTVKWGKPVAFITNVTYLDDDKSKLLVNYEVNTNNDYKIRNVYFRVSDLDGNEIANINEYYLDNKFIVKIPNGDHELNFEITFRCNNPVGDDYFLTQQVIFDEESKSLVPQNIYLGSENLKEYQYYIYKRNYTDEEFRLSKKMAGIQRELDDNIRYENAHFKLVKNYDADKQLFLVSPSFSICTDPAKKDNVIGTYLYPELAEERLDSYQDMLVDLIAGKDTLQTAEEISEAEDNIAELEHEIDLLKNHPISKKAAEFNNSRNRIRYLDKARHYAKNSFEYKIVKSDGRGRFSETSVYEKEQESYIDRNNQFVAAFEGFGKDHFFPRSDWFKKTMLPTLIASVIFGILVYVMVNKAKKGHDLYIRPIAGIQEIDNAIGRATEMGKPILFVPGLSSIGDVATLAGLAILGRVAKKAAEYDTRILVPVRDYIVLPIAQEIVKEAHYEAGRPDTYDKNSVFFITDSQFAFVAGVNGIMIREKTATNFYMGMFWAEALLMTETGSSTGAIQISGTDAVTQIPFFITTCDYTLIGEELYAASAYLAREPLQIGTLKAVDYLKLLILIFIISGTLLSTVHLTFLINAFPEK